MKKVISFCDFRTENSEGVIYELEDTSIIIGFSDPLHGPKIITHHYTKTENFPDSGFNKLLRISKETETYIVSNDSNSIRVAVYE